MPRCESCGKPSKKMQFSKDDVPICPKCAKELARAGGKKRVPKPGQKKRGPYKTKKKAAKKAERTNERTNERSKARANSAEPP